MSDIVNKKALFVVIKIIIWLLALFGGLIIIFFIWLYLGSSFEFTLNIPTNTIKDKKEVTQKEIKPLTLKKEKEELANKFLQKAKEICGLKGLEEFEYNDTNFAFKCNNKIPQ
ncbi:hypothetical protein [Helicobacter cetorum]|uniref:hypothetical protein n=1 Tax=Helicobacter cetorum TaxID=138563 RepID=UPI000CF017DF|nr:hypothetical protein [Helicobacter cetorum]